MKSQIVRINKIALAAFVVALVLTASGAFAGRMELARIFEHIPPNGPAARYGNVTMVFDTDNRAPVIFPHWLHRARYTCKTCHLDLSFSLYSGESGMSRKQMVNGLFCGACHDGATAFSLHEESRNCDRCHLVQPERLDQRFTRFAHGLPASDAGNQIDWHETLSQGYISLQDSVNGKRRTNMTLPEDLSRPLLIGSQSPRLSVAFSHEDHFEWLDCSNCHPLVFNINKGKTEHFSMKHNVFGWFCGTCHMRVAFPMQDCQGCHPQIKKRPML